MTRRFFFTLFSWAFSVVAAWSAPVVLQPKTNNGQAVEQIPVTVNGQSIKAWNCDEKAVALTFKSPKPIQIPANGALYVKIDYVDQGYGKLNVQFTGQDRKNIKPDRVLGFWRTDSKRVISAGGRISGIQPDAGGEVSVRIGLERPKGETLVIAGVTLQDEPFKDARFAYVISDPWARPYTGPSIKPRDNTTLKGKVMVGYQGWFRTPNDPEGRGWVHWGNINDGMFTTDMWPDISQYPPEALEKAANVKLKSGKQGYLFSSAWPGVVNTHFRWMRENDIDGAFLQRFVKDSFCSISGNPEWVLANVREAANREGRIWAVEYDVSGYPDAKLLETLKTDWKWFVDTFGVLKDPNYARENGKPVVFIWGMPFPDRKISPETANAVVDFFKNDPKYGGNYVIGGIPGNWRKSEPVWQDHFRKYDSVLCWMSQSYAEDVADFKKLGLNYYAHVKPGFSWANLKHLPSDDLSVAYTPRDGGKHYWGLLSKASKAGVDRLFVGMFDEYDESTAIIPMSDDAPPTPVRPGVAATFYNGARAVEQGEFVLLPGTDLELGSAVPARKVSPENFFVRMGGQIVCPAPGEYAFAIEGAVGDDAELFINGRKILSTKNISETAQAKETVTVSAAGDAVPFRLEYRHGAGTGKMQLLWQTPGAASRVPVPSGALQDAWGRFITNDGKPSDWYLKLTRMGKEMMNGKRPADSPMP